MRQGASREVHCKPTDLMCIIYYIMCLFKYKQSHIVNHFMFLTQIGFLRASVQTQATHHQGVNDINRRP